MSSCQKFGIILENKVGTYFKIEVVKNVNNKKCGYKVILFNKNVFLERFRYWKLDFESQIFSLFDNSAKYNNFPLSMLIFGQKSI